MFIPNTYPAPHIAKVVPPDGTIQSRSEVESSIGHEYLEVDFFFLAGAGVDRDKGIRFGLDGTDITESVGFQGTTDEPQSSAGGLYRMPIPVGEHRGAVSYCDHAGQVYTYTWRFTVIE